MPIRWTILIVTLPINLPSNLAVPVEFLRTAKFNGKVQFFEAKPGAPTPSFTHPSAELYNKRQLAYLRNYGLRIKCNICITESTWRNVGRILSKSLRRPPLRRSWIRSLGEYVTIARRISPLSKRRRNSAYGFSPSFTFAVSKTQGRRNYWKTRSVKYFLDKMKNNPW